MLSDDYNIGKFIEKIRGCSFEEIILLTDREATKTERHLYKYCRKENCEPARRYALTLKDFILFMRYGVLTRWTRGLDLYGFHNRMGAAIKIH